MDTINDGLIGIDPDDTLKLELSGATFVVGTIPAGVYEGLLAQRAMLRRDAMCRAIPRLVAAGKDPEAMFEHKGIVSTLTNIEMESVMDPDYVKGMMSVMLEGVKHSLRSHDKFMTKKRGAVPFKRDEVTGVLHPETLRHYAVNPTLLEGLWVLISALNTLEVTGKKA